jgi:hypothetical protein
MLAIPMVKLIYILTFCAITLDKIDRIIISNKSNRVICQFLFSQHDQYEDVIT